MPERRLRHVGVTVPAQGGHFSVDDVRQIEDLGYDSLALGEHVMFHVPTLNGLIALAYAAAVTERIALLTAVTLVPLYPPVLLAKMTASLDVLSGGRLNLGVGVGGEYPKEFEAMGVPVAERGQRADEALEVLRTLWSGDTVDFAGEFTTFTGGRIQPPPVQRPHPPIWVSGRHDKAIRRAARFGDWWMPYLYSPEQLAKSVMALREHCDALDRDPGEISSALFCFLHAHPDGARARRIAADTVGATYQQDFGPMAERYLVAGTPAECTRRLGEYASAGADGIVLMLACTRDEFAGMARRVQEEILPDLVAEPSSRG